MVFLVAAVTFIAKNLTTFLSLKVYQRVHVNIVN